MRVKIKNATFKFLVLLVIAGTFFIFKTTVAKAEQINFSQSILPVKLVYLDKYGEIEKIWSNADCLSSFYVIKFYVGGEQKEVPVGSLVFKNYGKTLTKFNSPKNSNFMELKVDFLQRPGGFEEVQTYV